MLKESSGQFNKERRGEERALEDSHDTHLLPILADGLQARGVVLGRLAVDHLCCGHRHGGGRDHQHGAAGGHRGVALTAPFARVPLHQFTGQAGAYGLVFLALLLVEACDVRHRGVEVGIGVGTVGIGICADGGKIKNKK